MKRSRSRTPRAGRGRVTWEAARRIGLALPEVEEGTCYGTPALRVAGKLFARLKEDGESLVIRVDIEERKALLKADPGIFYVTDHYLNYPWILLRLSRVTPEELRRRLEQAWRRAAPRRVAAMRP